MKDITATNEKTGNNGIILSVLIKAEPEKESFRRNIKKTIKGLDAPAAQGAPVEIIMVFDDKAEADKSKYHSKSGRISIRNISASEVGSTPAGRYIMKMGAGDVVNDEGFRGLMDYICRTDRGVYAIPWSGKNEEVDKKKAVQGNEWRSILASYFPEVLDPHCVAIRRDLVDDPADLLAKDLKASGAVIKAVLKAEGYEEIGSKTIIRSEYKPGINTEIKSDVMEDLLAFSREKYGCVEDFLQKCFMSLFQTQLERHGDKRSVGEYIKYVRDDIISNYKLLSFMSRVYLLNIKYGKDVLKDAVIEDYGAVKYNDSVIGVLHDIRVRIDVTEVEEGHITFEGRTDVHLLGDRYSLYMLSSDGHKYDIDVRPFPPFDETGLDGELYYQGMMFSITVPSGNNISYRIYLEDANGRRLLVEPAFSKYSKFIAGCPVKSLSLGGYFITYSGGTFEVKTATRALERKAERTVLRYLIGRKKYAVAVYRILVALDRLFSPKPVWIVADRPHVANDNGEHMFRFLQTTEEAKKCNIYFLIREDSPDYPRLKKTGKVLKYGSHMHKIKFLRSQVILCAAANDLVINAMGKDSLYYRDLLKYDFVYLRHGVSHNDQSGWINKLGKNIRILVATCRPEYEGILNGDYDYTEREVRLTGLPRFDNLYDEKQKEILILPTWRKNLQGKMEKHSSEREYVETFVDSDYCKFYNALINDERLLSVMEKYGYTGTFYLHPVFEKQYGDFHSSRLIKVGPGIADYQELFRRSAIMVTDFSSVAFDFAYLKKPVIYSQFDEAEFYKNHSWGKGYFTYREDGFGPITNTVEETVDELIYNIENDCKMRDEYVKKVEKFFAYTDRNNCRRVYEAIRDVERSKNERRTH